VVEYVGWRRKGHVGNRAEVGIRNGKRVRNGICRGEWVDGEGGKSGAVDE
jgi:hypothetical protein